MRARTVRGSDACRSVSGRRARCRAAVEATIFSAHRFGGSNGNEGGQSLLRATTEGLGMKELAVDARALKAERDARRFATDRLAGGVFVGREREVGELCAAIEAAKNGRGSLFLLSGEPGIGKTRLADRVADLAADRGVPVLWGRAFEGEVHPHSGRGCR
jgi:AAA ATPase domain